MAEEIKLMKGWVLFKVIKDNDIIDYTVIAKHIAGFSQYSQYTTLVTLDDFDNGKQIIVVEPIKEVRNKINEALQAEEDK